MGWYWQDTRCPPPHLLYHSPPQLGRGRKKHNENFLGCNQDREESLNNYCKRQSRLDLWKSVLIYYRSHRSRILRKKNFNLKTPSPHPSLLPGLNFTPNFLYLLPHDQHRGTGNGDCGRLHHVFSAAPSSGEGVLTLFP